MKEEIWELEKTKRGYPATWESGGGMTNTGRAIIVAGENGEALEPVYIRRAGHLAGQEHALFIVKRGYHIIKAYHHRYDYTIYIYRIAEIFTEDDKIKAKVELINKFDRNEWDNDLDEKLVNAVEAAKKKARCYHCRRPHYYKTENQ